MLQNLIAAKMSLIYVIVDVTEAIQIKDNKIKFSYSSFRCAIWRLKTLVLGKLYFCWNLDVHATSYFICCGIIILIQTFNFGGLTQMETTI